MEPKEGVSKLVTETLSFLFKENIDDAMIFERYQLLNSIYSKVYNYAKTRCP